MTYLARLEALNAKLDKMNELLAGELMRLTIESALLRRKR